MDNGEEPGDVVAPLVRPHESEYRTPCVRTSPQTPPRPSTQRTRNGRRAVLLAVLVAIIGYAVVERVVTRSNVDRVIAFESYADDTVIIGLADDQPGFVLLAHLPTDRVHVDAQVASSWLVGKHTLLGVRTSGHDERFRLRSPLAILVSESGEIRAVTVNWSAAQFQELLHAADCESGCKLHPHRCGAPLDDIAAALTNWPAAQVPPPVRDFIRGTGG